MTAARKRSTDKDLHVRLYRLMLKIRLAEERIVAIYPSDKIQSPVHLSIGQEAVSVGVCTALRPGDRIYGTYRGHGLYIALGGHLGRMFAELYGKDAGCGRGKGGSMHLAAPEVGLMGCSAIVASTIPLAVGDALASQTLGHKRVVVAFFGDGAVDEGVFFESVNFAVLRKLPVLFVCENNGYAIHSRVSDRHRQTALYRVCEGLGLKGTRHNGNDVFAVHKTVQKAVDAIHAGAPPVLLELMTHRWHEHVGPGVDLEESYRDPNERNKAMRSDPINCAGAALLRRLRIDKAVLALWRREIEAEVDAAVAFAEQAPPPSPERLYADLYA